jgi:signal transduction histidine kinase
MMNLKGNVQTKKQVFEANLKINNTTITQGQYDNVCRCDYISKNELTKKVDEDLQETRQFQAINEQRSDEKKAEGHDRLKSTFFANMVHEIRTPASIIKSFAGFLQTTGLPENEKEEYTHIISRCADDLLNLINDLLDISKIEAGQLTIEEKPGNLKNLFDELFELFNTRAGHYKSENVQLKSFIEFNQEQCIINTDFTRLKQIMVNLICNALKFTQNGYVHFGCRFAGNKTLLFYVKDTGVGIEPKMQDVIFDRYKQINDSNTENQCKGTGLGLSIVKSLVELMQGKVWIESTPGIGSVFYFSLPYKKAKPTTLKTGILY